MPRENLPPWINPYRPPTAVDVGTFSWLTATEQLEVLSKLRAVAGGRSLETATLSVTTVAAIGTLVVSNFIGAPSFAGSAGLESYPLVLGYVAFIATGSLLLQYLGFVSHGKAKRAGVWVAALEPYARKIPLWTQ